MNLNVLVAETLKPLTLQEVKDFLRVVESDDDAYINMLISVVANRFKQITKRSCMPITYEAYLDGFCKKIFLEKPQVASVTSVEYMDTDGNWNTVSTSDYETFLGDKQCYIEVNYGTTWPTGVMPRGDSVKITYVAGYLTADDIPAEAKEWMLVRLADMFENRQSEIIGTITSKMGFVDHMLDSLIVPEEFYS